MLCFLYIAKVFMQITEKFVFSFDRIFKPLAKALTAICSLFSNFFAKGMLIDFFSKLFHSSQTVDKLKIHKLLKVLSIFELILGKKCSA